MPDIIPMDMATCSYNEYKPEMGVAVRTSRGEPKWFPYPMLTWEAPMPDWNMLHIQDRDVFTEAYFKKLNMIGVDNLIYQRNRILEHIAMSNSGELPHRLVLLCYEKLSKPGKWCHRSVFAEWWTQNTGEHVSELGSIPHLHVEEETGELPLF